VCATSAAYDANEKCRESRARKTIYVTLSLPVSHLFASETDSRHFYLIHFVESSSPIGRSSVIGRGEMWRRHVAETVENGSVESFKRNDRTSLSRDITGYFDLTWW
jgi:hypothetical protein